MHFDGPTAFWRETALTGYKYRSQASIKTSSI